MILGRSHPNNDQRQVTIDVEPGGGYVVLSAAEYERFIAGQPVVRRSGDCHGDFKFTLHLERTSPPPMYYKCRHCDHFVERSNNGEPGAAEWVHLDDGEQEYDHDAEPGVVAGKTLSDWQQARPELFERHADDKIGPNSIHHDRRGKVDEGSFRFDEEGGHVWSKGTTLQKVLARLAKLGTVTRNGCKIELERFDGSKAKGEFFPAK